MTGITTYEPDQPRVHIELLQSVKAHLARIALLADSGVSDCLVRTNMRVAEEAGLRVEVVRITGGNPDLIGAFEAVGCEGDDAFVVLEHPVNGANAARIAELALKRGTPTVFARAQDEAGGLFAYGTDLRAAGHEIARYAIRILRGAKPSGLAVERFHRPELVVNMKTARGLGVKVPPDLLNRAVGLMTEGRGATAMAQPASDSY